jgi:hypothetical protein
MSVRQMGSLFAIAILLASIGRSQEQVDKGDVSKRGILSTKDMTIRVRLTKATSDAKAYALSWKRGGQGLGGEVFTGDFLNAEGATAFEINAWSRPLPIDVVVGKAGWAFPNIIVSPVVAKKAKAIRVTDVAVEMEFADKGVVFKAFTEDAP